jgi:hypothetical protein
MTESERDAMPDQPLTYYPHLREVLDPRLGALSDSEIEAVFADALGEDVSPAEYEELFGNLGRAFEKVARDVGRVAASAAPGVLQGAAAGSAHDAGSPVWASSAVSRTTGSAVSVFASSCIPASVFR